MTQLSGTGDLFQQTMDFLGLPAIEQPRALHSSMASAAYDLAMPEKPSFVEEIEQLLTLRPPPPLDTIQQNKKAAAATRQLKKKGASFKRKSKKVKGRGKGKDPQAFSPPDLPDPARLLVDEKTIDLLTELLIPEEAFPVYDISAKSNYTVHAPNSAARIEVQLKCCVFRVKKTAPDLTFPRPNFSWKKLGGPIEAWNAAKLASGWA